MPACFGIAKMHPRFIHSGYFRIIRCKGGVFCFHKYVFCHRVEDTIGKIELQDTETYDRIIFMKTDIHPTYFPDAKIMCACGNIIQAGGTKKEMSVEICGACHPFYTGKEKIIDAAGRVEKFKARVEKAKATTLKKKPKKTERVTASVERKATKAKTTKKSR